MAKDNIIEFDANYKKRETNNKHYNNFSIVEVDFKNKKTREKYINIFEKNYKHTINSLEKTFNLLDMELAKQTFPNELEEEALREFFVWFNNLCDNDENLATWYFLYIEDNIIDFCLDIIKEYEGSQIYHNLDDNQKNYIEKVVDFVFKDDIMWNFFGVSPFSVDLVDSLSPEDWDIEVWTFLSQGTKEEKEGAKKMLRAKLARYMLFYANLLLGCNKNGQEYCYGFVLGNGEIYTINKEDLERTISSGIPNISTNCICDVANCGIPNS